MNLVFPLPRALDRSSSSHALPFSCAERSGSLGNLAGLRLATFPEGALSEALRAHEAGAEVLKRDHRAFVSASVAAGRPVVVKEVTKGGLLRRAADSYRGSPGRRAWLGGHGLVERGIAAALPLAFVESRRAGIPRRSLVVLEDLRAEGGSFLDRAPDRPASAEALCRLLFDLLLRLHRAGVDHGDLQAQHVYLRGGRTAADDLTPVLIDLEGVRFARQLGDEARIRALAQLNASLADARIPAALRRRGFERYADALPFHEAREHALARIVAESLRRQHAWKGVACPQVETPFETPGRDVRSRR